MKFEHLYVEDYSLYYRPKTKKEKESELSKEPELGDELGEVIEWQIT